jgi:lysophospholipase L1-like esterase
MSVPLPRPWSRYVALGDSISAGFGSVPATQGFPYQLYQSGAIDNLANTVFCNMAVPGATTKDVLDYQVPQVKRFLHGSNRKVITLQMGGNELAQILENPASLNDVLTAIYINHLTVLQTLTTQFPDAHIYVANFFDPKIPVPGVRDVVMAMNQLIAGAAAQFPSTSVTLVDVFSAFEGRSGLLINEKNGADEFIADVSTAGQVVLTQAFKGAIR